jgi:hypothetical protein
MPSYVLGQSARTEGELGETWRHLREALGASGIILAAVSTISVLCAMAALLATEGRKQPAVE